jgi:tetratricopeptide (TPR) repeat protein
MRGTSSGTRGSATVFLILLLLVSASAFMTLKARTDGIVRRKVPGSSVIYLPSGKLLRYATFGYSALAADLVYLWAIQYYSTPTIDDRFDHLDHVFSIISELDPRYADPYEVGAMIAVQEARDPQAAFRILDRGHEKNPDLWTFSFQAGHIAMMTLKDFELAERYFRTCMEIPGAPDFVRRLHANAIFRKGDLQTSWETWLEIYNSAPDERTRKIASNHLYNVKSTIDLAEIGKALAAFRERYGRWPGDLEALVRTGLLARVPRDLDDEDYVYDPATGDVRTRISPWRR